MRNNYSVDDIRAFCGAVRLGQFTEAAALLFITPSALSRRIANIESSVGGKVFDRSTRRLRLTPLGAVLYDRLSPLLAQLDGSFMEAARKAKGEEGTLAVAMVATVAHSVLPCVLDEFHKRHPSVFVSVRDGIANSITNMVEERIAEFGITTHMAFSASIEAQSLGIYGFNLIFGSNNLGLAKRRRIRWEDLVGMKVVGLNPMSSTRLQVDGELAAAGIDQPWTMEADQLSTLLELVRSQGYVTVLPSVFRMSTSDLKQLSIVNPDIQRELYVVKRRDASVTPQASTLATLIKKQIERQAT